MSHAAKSNRTNLFFEFVAHDWRRGRPVILIATGIMAVLYVANILKPYDVGVISAIVAFADVRLLNLWVSFLLLVFAMTSLTVSWRDGTNHLLLSLPARGRELVWARLVSIALPAVLLLLPSWPVLRTRSIALSSFEVEFYLRSLSFVQVSSQLVLSTATVLPAGHIAVVAAIALKVVFFAAFGIFMFAAQEWTRQACHPLGWLVSVFLWLLLLSSIGLAGSMAFLIPGFLEFSCAGWWFGIADCTISVPVILFMLLLTGAFMWFSILAWDRRLET